MQYKYVRADHVNAIFEVINWDAVPKRFAEGSARFFSIFINPYLFFIVLIEYVFSFKYMPQIQSIGTLPCLVFEYKDLEPFILRYIMKIHHQNHHKTCIENYNKTLDQLRTAVARDDTAKIISLAPALKYFFHIVNIYLFL